MAMSSVSALTRGESTLAGLAPLAAVIAGLAPLAAAASLACAAETRCDHGTRPERGAASPARSTETAHHPSRVGPALIVTNSPRRTASSSAASAAKSDTTHAISPTQPEEGRRPEAGPLRGVCGCCRSLTGVGGAPADSVLEQTPIRMKKSRSRRRPNESAVEALRQGGGGQGGVRRAGGEEAGNGRAAPGSFPQLPGLGAPLLLLERRLLSGLYFLFLIPLACPRACPVRA